MFPSAKSDGREHLTVTDTKPVIMPSGGNNTTTDLTNNNNNNNHNNNSSHNNNSNNNEHLGNGLLSHATNEHSDADADDDVDADAGCGFTEQSLADILDPELQPEPPIPNDAESQAIYRAHRHMAKEYLSVDTNIYYAQDFKDKLILQMDRTEREQKMELLRKMKDKVKRRYIFWCYPGSNSISLTLQEDLQSLYNNLQKQRDKQARLAPPAPSGQDVPGGGGEPVESDGWVVIAPHHNT